MDGPQRADPHHAPRQLRAVPQTVRTQARAQRIAQERRYNENYDTERRLSHMLIAVRDRPPPF